MSTTSTIITIVICLVLVAAVGFALVKGIWSAAKKITVPIQIALFVVMLVCVSRLFCTKENAQKLYKGIEQTGISQNVENTMRSALALKSKDVSGVETKLDASAKAPDATEMVTTPAQKTEVEAPTVVNIEAKATPASQSVAESAAAPEVEPSPAPVKVPDYSHLNKGKKTFTYALPFNANVTVGFKDNTYRVIAESIGRLDASEKKEIGKMIITALGEYAGKKIGRWDKSKISIESRYDESDSSTRVFAIIPPEAID